MWGRFSKNISAPHSLLLSLWVGDSQESSLDDFEALHWFNGKSVEEVRFWWRLRLVWTQGRHVLVLVFEPQFLHDWKGLDPVVSAVPWNSKALQFWRQLSCSTLQTSSFSAFLLEAGNSVCLSPAERRMRFAVWEIALNGSHTPEVLVIVGQCSDNWAMSSSLVGRVVNLWLLIWLLE